MFLGFWGRGRKRREEQKKEQAEREERAKKALEQEEEAQRKFFEHVESLKVSSLELRRNQMREALEQGRLKPEGD